MYGRFSATSNTVRPPNVIADHLLIQDSAPLSIKKRPSSKHPTFLLPTFFSLSRITLFLAVHSSQEITRQSSPQDENPHCIQFGFHCCPTAKHGSNGDVCHGFGRLGLLLAESQWWPRLLRPLSGVCSGAFAFSSTFRKSDVDPLATAPPVRPCRLRPELPHYPYLRCRPSSVQYAEPPRQLYLISAQTAVSDCA